MAPLQQPRLPRGIVLYNRLVLLKDNLHGFVVEWLRVLLQQGSREVA